jgi:hypothetical protein
VREEGGGLINGSAMWWLYVADWTLAGPSCRDKAFHTVLAAKRGELKWSRRPQRRLLASSRCWMTGKIFRPGNSQENDSTPLRPKIPCRSATFWDKLVMDKSGIKYIAFQVENGLDIDQFGEKVTTFRILQLQAKPNLA